MSQELVSAGLVDGRDLVIGQWFIKKETHSSASHHYIIYSLSFCTHTYIFLIFFHRTDTLSLFPVAANLQKIVDEPQANKNVTFKLVSAAPSSGSTGVFFFFFFKEISDILFLYIVFLLTVNEKRQNFGIFDLPDLLVRNIYSLVTVQPRSRKIREAMEQRKNVWTSCSDFCWGRLFLLKLTIIG